MLLYDEYLLYELSVFSNFRRKIREMVLHKLRLYVYFIYCSDLQRNIKILAC